jgi:putative spermidine/putrescine transport system permease protein
VGPEGRRVLTNPLATRAEATDVLRPGLARPGRRRLPLAWLGAAPFLLYAFAFLLLPAGQVLVGAFRDEAGGWTLDNVSQLYQGQFLKAYKTSIELSLVTAFAGGLLGLLIAYSAIRDRTPRWIRPILTTFSGIAAQFGGIPLAFAFIATLGTVGLVTRFLNDAFSLDLYGHGFTLFSFSGLALTYLYFQIPLMILVIAPALDGLKREWREAASNLGASPTQFWRHVGLPVLMPSILGAIILLFGNAFAAYATAYSLTSGKINLVPLAIGQVMLGDVLSNRHLGQALALGMVVVLAVMMLLYLPLQRRATRWSR